ncbi:hypothetical protein GGX14DRAFT_580529 [Mycena pura]|uniref:Uncharacterized protein n=1 Tax=Mycena pura TaxID=153505 RepID=A0AAD6USR9_9AGAR|nr:hypothetical protein GGX14DRAFT_580529 [Mycena pura]
MARKAPNPAATGPTAPAAAPKKRRSRAKAAPETIDDSSDVEPAGRTQRVQVNWIKNPDWTHAIVEYLNDNPSFRIKLFSDSTADAKKEKRPKQTAKDGKAVQFGVLAKHIFADDPKEQARYANDPAKYATSTETRLRRLKKEYQGYLERVGATGAGLDPARVYAGSTLANVFEEIREEWPWWDDLHAFWRELPNYNPIGVQSSEPGTDHASAAATLFEGHTASTSEDDDLVDEPSPSAPEADELEDTGGDEKSHSSMPDSEDEQEPAEQHSAYSPSPRSKTSPPPPVITAQAAQQPKSMGQTKAAAVAPRFGRDLGLAKAQSSSTGAKKRPQNAVDRLNDIRESESTRLGEKRKLQHREEMERIKIKKMKYELKLLHAQNERMRLNRLATSPSPRRRVRVLDLSSPSPIKSKSQSARSPAMAPRPVAFQLRTSSDPSIDSLPGTPYTPYSDPGLWDMSGMDFSSASTSSANWDLMLSTDGGSSANLKEYA